ncbi:MAG TPA: hypothetical protein VEN82_01705, partial [Actinomycetota bacterium]|nr:hypothetical protein [Actinomycetota bacterium]
VGAALVLGGAILLTTGAVRVATRGTLSAGTTGALLAAVLAGGYRTATEVLALRRGGADPAAGGLFVSAATFALGVPGAAAIIRPLTIDSGASTAFIAASVISALAATVLMARQRAGRTLGVALIGLYAMWIVLAPRF